MLRRNIKATNSWQLRNIPTVSLISDVHPGTQYSQVFSFLFSFLCLVNDEVHEAFVFFLGIDALNTDKHNAEDT